MNETLSSNIWPSFENSRQNWNDQFKSNSANSWQYNINNSTEIYQSPVDLNTLWSAKSEVSDECEKDSYIKSIWSTSASPNHNLSENNILTMQADSRKSNFEKASADSQKLNISYLIVSNERWGNIKINQTTPWTICEIDDSEKRARDPMVWRAKVDGTEIWEEYYTKQHGKRRPHQIDNSSFNASEIMWSSSSDISQNANLLWSNKSNEVNSAGQTDLFLPNYGGNGNNHSNFSSNNGVRQSMTRNQAQKYLQEMGFSLSDSIGALVNNQMDLPKALNELQSKYRIFTNGVHQSYNNRLIMDNGSLTRIPPCSPINPIVGQNASMVNSNYPNNIEMFHSDISDQMMDSKYMGNMDQNMTAFNRMSETSCQHSSNLSRQQDSFRNNFHNSGINNRAMSTNSGHFPNSSDMGLLNQGMNRMNMNFNVRSNSITNNSSFNGLHNNNNNNSNSNSNNNYNMDLRQNGSGIPNIFGRSISKPSFFSLNNSGMNWNTESSVMSPNGAMSDTSQSHLAKNISCLARPDKIAIVIKKVQHKHIDFIKSICMDSGAMVNFHLNPQAQSIIVQFTNIQEAYRCLNIIQSQLSLRVELINSQDDFIHYMTGAN